MSYRGRPVLLLGSSGFIGRWVARALTAAGANLILVPKPYHDQFERIGLSIKQHSPSHIFNLAGYGVRPADPDYAMAQLLNVDLPVYLAASSGGARLIHAGSSAEYGSTDQNITEETLCCPNSWYGRSKLAGTEAVASYANGIVARLFNVYGPGEAEWRLIPSLLRASRDDTPVALTSGKQCRDFIYVQDVAEGLLRLGMVPPGPVRVVNLASGKTVAIRDVILTAARVFRIDASRLQFGTMGSAGLDLSYGSVSLERLRQITGWQPTITLDEGLRACRSFPVHETIEEHA